jgi:hypothetical protein
VSECAQEGALKSRNGLSNTTSAPKKEVRAEGAEPVTRSGTPSSEKIRQRAFEIYIERGAVHGRDLDDWLQAGRELRGECGDTESGAAEKLDANSRSARA